MVLTINGGSSSIKFALFEAGGSLRGFWRAHRADWTAGGRLAGERPEPGGQLFAVGDGAGPHGGGGALMDWIGERLGRDALTAVGHRVVHGGPKYSEPQRITAEMVEELRRSAPSILSICRRRSC